MYRSPQHDRESDGGFGLVEIVVSMLLLALIAVAFLPVLITSLTVSADNASNTAAIQLMNRDLEAARQQGSSCSTIRNWGSSTTTVTIANEHDNAFPWYRTERVVGACPEEYPATVQVEIRVYGATQQTGGSLTSSPLMSTSTLIYVTSA